MSRRELTKAAIVALAWIAYGLFPLVSGLFHVPRTPYWEESLLFALAAFGYCTIGCWLYAITGRRGVDECGQRHDTTLERMRIATFFSVFAFIFALLMALDIPLH